MITIPDPLRGKITQESEDKFSAPAEIVTTVHSAQAIYQSLRQSHLGRIALYAEIEGLIQGNPPYDPQVLREAGLDHIANFNDMSAHSVYQRAALAYFNLTHNVDSIANFSLRIPTGDAPEWAKIMALNLDEALAEHWPSFYINLASLSAQLVKYGISPVIFPDERDPRWRVVELNRFFIPDQTQSDLDLLTTVCIETTFTVQYLWQVYAALKGKESPFWNLPELGKLLVHLANSHIKDAQVQVGDLLDLEQRMLNGDQALTGIYQDTIKLVSLLQKEYDGKVSHYMFHRYQCDANEFIFKSSSQYEDFGEALTIFTLHPGEYTIHANKGVGHKLFSLSQAKIQADCSVVDMAKWASTPIVKSSSLNARDVQQIRFYPGVPTDIGTAELAQNNLGANVQNVVSAAQYLQNLLQFNLSYGGNDPGQVDADQGSLSPTQTRIRASREFSILKNNALHYYATLDRLLANMVSKMLKSKKGYPAYELCKAWKDKCIEDGVPEEIFTLTPRTENGWKLPRHIKVTASRAVGAGSQTAMLSGLDGLMPYMGTFNEAEARAFKRDVIIANVGKEHLSRYMQEEGIPDEAKGGSSLAGVENAIMEGGKAPVFSLDNRHRAHIVTHMQLAQQMISGIQEQQLSPVEADSVFNVLIPHMQEHVMALANDVFAQQFLQQIQEPVAQISRYAALNRKNAASQVQAQIRQQQEDQAQTEQLLNEEERKNVQLQGEEERKNIKLSEQLKRQEEMSDRKADVLERKTQAEIDALQRKTEADTQAKLTKAGKGATDNTAQSDMEADPVAYIRAMNGNTPSPYDIER